MQIEGRKVGWRSERDEDEFQADARLEIVWSRVCLGLSESTRQI
jgi:hypothetical protein